MKKLTKIIATVGPADESLENLSNLIDLGVNIFRFNVKHNDLAWHKEKIKAVKEIAEEKNVAIGTLLDLQGPEIRTVVPGDVIELEANEEVLVGESDEHQIKKFTVSHPSVLSHLEEGQRIVVEDGRATLHVKKVLEKGAILTSDAVQEVKTKKTFNLPGASYPMPVLTEKDYEAIEMAAKVHVDFIALSFVRTAKDIKDLREVLEKHNYHARIISKIETRIALDNLDEIIETSDGIMVARGDLGIEIPMEQVPYYQKIMIKKCIEQGIPVITATQMLISMTEKPYPTRAEVSDIANAVYDMTDTVMLSEESAMGHFPDKAVALMAKTAEYCEKQELVEDTRRIYSHKVSDTEEMLCDTAYNLYLQFLKQKKKFGGFILFSQTGRTARKLSAYRPRVPIFVFTPDEIVKGGLTMNFGVSPFVQPKLYGDKSDVRIEDMKGAFEYLEKRELIDPEKNYVLLYGDNWRVAGSVSTIKVIPPKK